MEGSTDGPVYWMEGPAAPKPRPTFDSSGRPEQRRGAKGAIGEGGLDPGIVPGCTVAIMMISTLVLALAFLPQMTHQSGAAVMGFDQDKTAHHFYLYPDGGAIEVAVKDSADTVNLTAIRAHLPHIATMFSEGNFEAPMLVHQTDVPGTPDMKKVKDAITWRYEESPRGGRVNITTKNAEALKALHAFLRFQITDHKTGDSLEVRKR